MISDILETIGNTPLIEIGTGIYCKLEMFNPTGSIKDRIAKEMILKLFGHFDDPSGFTVLEASSGNTGISVAFVAAALGMNSIIYCPENTSKIKVALMKRYGAKVIQHGIKIIPDAIRKAQQKEKKDKSCFYLNQFENKDNLSAQIKMAKETIPHLANPDAIVAGVGTGGTIMGLHEVFPNAEVFLVYPNGDTCIEGITDHRPSSFIPKALHRTQVHVNKQQAESTAWFLRTKLGIDCGLSSGANFYAANMLRSKYKRIITVFADNGWRYILNEI